MKTSLIITTYNRKAALKYSVLSALSGKVLPDEIIIADDGSSDGTDELVKKIDEKASIPVIHSWQEDKGFRLSLSRNRALKKASGDLIIMVDGDMLLHPLFTADHIKFSEKGFFLQGSRVLLKRDITEKIISGEPCKINLFKMKNIKNAIYSPFLARLTTKREKTDLKKTRGCNMSFWYEDVRRINGFNNKFISWGREDSEFVARLYNAGIKRRFLKFAGIQYHLYHPEGKAVNSNEELLEETIENKAVACRDGLAQCMEER